MTQPKLSLQLYTVRDALAADLDGTLARVSRLGFQNVEAFGAVHRAPELAEAFARNGLSSPTMHAALVTDANREPSPVNEAVFDAAAQLGAEIVIDPMVDPKLWATRDDIKSTAERLNVASSVAASRGIRVGYHNHSHEFHHEFSGESAYEYFVSLLDERVVLELDAYWAAVGKQDVPALVQWLGTRLVALHVKDGSIDADPFRADVSGPIDLGQVAAGTGAVPLDRVLDAADNLEFAVVEYDEFAGDVFSGIEASVQYLSKRGVR
ncbi:sugar phosphate isomerase/epimerase [Microbacterium halimionae]|uniref:Sugar phosphate isomerase/epimerase n=1 Tax=Microbacterium halimionae TaxID=1526413 RepID=A0A7W3JM94_9MICO|nr:sugar phosphate isomerase/epimerase [Microbacterium halimionae]MBA8815401.1 sugar phosphate isomerase/epimerase [Microbacterium halimionae]NII95448.1 sugar phosphate isomerase/epimerase [Microbacterium halimionae]